MALRVVAGAAGLTVAVGTLLSAISVLVLPRGVNTRQFRFVFASVRIVLQALSRGRDHHTRDRLLAWHAPLALLSLPVLWLCLVWLSFSALYVAAGIDTAWGALRVSGSSLLTLGFAAPSGAGETLLTFAEATIGLGLVTLLIAYLPTMYSAFSQRETEVALMEVRAGSPPTAWGMLDRFRRIGEDENLPHVWARWEVWFAQLDETHTSLAALPFYRSPFADRSWITAAGAVLDAASLYASTLRHGPVPRAGLCIRAGYTALRRICDLYGIDYPADPDPTDPISITREEYDEVYDHLAAVGYPMVEDRDEAWRDFSGWRVNYDRPLLALAVLLDAPWAPWSSDRSSPDHQAPRIRRRH